MVLWVLAPTCVDALDAVGALLPEVVMTVGVQCRSTVAHQAGQVMIEMVLPVGATGAELDTMRRDRMDLVALLVVVRDTKYI